MYVCVYVSVYVCVYVCVCAIEFNFVRPLCVCGDNENHAFVNHTIMVNSGRRRNYGENFFLYAVHCIGVCAQCDFPQGDSVAGKERIIPRGPTAVKVKITTHQGREHWSNQHTITTATTHTNTIQRIRLIHSTHTHTPPPAAKYTLSCRTTVVVDPSGIVESFQVDLSTRSRSVGLTGAIHTGLAQDLKYLMRKRKTTHHSTSIMGFPLRAAFLSF